MSRRKKEHRPTSGNKPALRNPGDTGNKKPVSHPSPEGSEEVRMSLTQTTSGPLPPASEFRAYEQTLPGGAERILAMAEKEQDHRFDWEKEALDAEIRDRKRGHYLVFVLTLFITGAIVYLTMYGHYAIAAILGGTVLLGLAKLFLDYRRE